MAQLMLHILEQLYLRLRSNFTMFKTFLSISLGLMFSLISFRSQADTFEAHENVSGSPYIESTLAGEKLNPNVTDTCTISFSGEFGYFKSHEIHAKCAAAMAQRTLLNNGVFAAPIRVTAVKEYSITRIFNVYDESELDGDYILEVTLQNGDKLSGDIGVRCDRRRDNLNKLINVVDCSLSNQNYFGWRIHPDYAYITLSDKNNRIIFDLKPGPYQERYLECSQPGSCR
jgi:hypothetical protein